MRAVSLLVNLSTVKLLNIKENPTYEIRGQYVDLVFTGHC